MALKLNKISHFFSNRLIFKDISFTTQKGSVTLLAGSNGAGKSTLLHIIAGLLSPSAGSVDLPTNGESIGMLGHKTFLYPELTAFENLTFWGNLHKKKVTQPLLEDILNRVDLLSYAKERSGIFSRGMTQRLSLARVLLLEPQVLLLDEPSTGLDITSMHILYREIQRAKESGSIVIWISHALESDLKYADQVAFLQKKRLAFFGSVNSFTIENFL